jgi:hypothetical protein
MKKFKIIDFWISVGLVILVTIIRFDQHIDYLLCEYLFSPYAIVGTWQVISMLVHAYHRWFTRDKGLRYTYHWIIFIALITVGAGSSWLLLSAGAFLTVFYTWLCYEEVYTKMKRPLDVLK